MTFLPLKFYGLKFVVQHEINRLGNCGSSLPGKSRPSCLMGTPTVDFLADIFLSLNGRLEIEIIS